MALEQLKAEHWHQYRALFECITSMSERDRAGMGPDGMAISSSGDLWVALPGSGSIACYSPTTDKEVTKVGLALPEICPETPVLT